MKQQMFIRQRMKGQNNHNYACRYVRVENQVTSFSIIKGGHQANPNNSYCYTRKA